MPEQFQYPNKTTEQHAKELYTAYCVEVGGKAFNGDPLPNWDSFYNDPNKEKQVNAWLKVGDIVRQEVYGEVQRAIDALG